MQNRKFGLFTANGAAGTPGYMLDNNSNDYLVDGAHDGPIGDAGTMFAIC